MNWGGAEALGGAAREGEGGRGGALQPRFEAIVRSFVSYCYFVSSLRKNKEKTSFLHILTGTFDFLSPTN